MISSVTTRPELFEEVQSQESRLSTMWGELCDSHSHIHSLTSINHLQKIWSKPNKLTILKRYPLLLPWKTCYNFMLLLHLNWSWYLLGWVHRGMKCAQCTVHEDMKIILSSANCLLDKYYRQGLWLWLVNDFYRLCCLQPYTSSYTQVHSAWTVGQWASHSQTWCFQFGNHMWSSPHWKVLGLGKVSSQWTQLGHLGATFRA